MLLLQQDINDQHHCRSNPRISGPITKHCFHHRMTKWGRHNSQHIVGNATSVFLDPIIDNTVSPQKPGPIVPWFNRRPSGWYIAQILLHKQFAQFFSGLSQNLVQVSQFRRRPRRSKSTLLPAKQSRAGHVTQTEHGSPRTLLTCVIGFHPGRVPIMKCVIL